MLTMSNPMGMNASNQLAMQISPFASPMQQISIVQKPAASSLSANNNLLAEQIFNVRPETGVMTGTDWAKTMEGQFTTDLRPSMPVPLASNKSIFEQQPQLNIQSVPAITPVNNRYTSSSSQALPYKPTLKKNGKHLILDLDETLVHTFGPEDQFMNFIEFLSEDQKKRLYSMKFPEGDILFGYIRPYAEDFLRVAFAEFESVGVWSAGTKYYVEKVVELIFKEQQPVFVLSRDQCNELKISDETEPCRYKPLDVIYHRYPDHNEKNTVIVDDRHDVCALNCMNNIRVPEFDLNSRNYQTRLKDRTLDILTRWIQTDEFRNNNNVPMIKGKSPFRIDNKM